MKSSEPVKPPEDVSGCGFLLFGCIGGVAGSIITFSGCLAFGLGFLRSFGSSGLAFFACWIVVGLIAAKMCRLSYKHEVVEYNRRQMSRKRRRKSDLG